MSARSVAETVTDPELPMLTLADLGVLRDVQETPEGVVVTITPTYTGCPAMDAMRDDLRRALNRAGYAKVEVRTVLSPAWTTDWITEDGRRKLTEAGIAPPAPAHLSPATPDAAQSGAAGSGSARPGPAAADSARPGTGAPGAGAAGSARSGAGAPGVGAAGSARLGAGWPRRGSRGPIPLSLSPPVRRVPCPLCGSSDTELLSEFSATACKALRRCRACAEPFEHVKEI